MTPRLALALVALTAVALPVVPLAAADPVPPTDLPASAQEYTDSRGRGEDQLANPGFLAGTAAADATFLAKAGADGGVAINLDPYREAWSRGVEVDFPLRTRYGATLAGTLYAPPASRRGLFPGVLYLAGAGTADRAGQAVAQSLAEAGYVVWTITGQDSPGNDPAPPDPDPSTPQNEYCEPGAWQRPQELGIRETGPCAGQLDMDTSPTASATALAATPDYYTQDPAGILDGLSADYERFRAARVFPALDAADQLLSARNPLRSRVDGSRLGIVGWSLGAHAALIVGNADRRFSAVVTHDSFGRIGPTTSPRVPTLFLEHDLRNDGPRTQTTDLSRLPGVRDAQQFVLAGVPTGVVVPRGSRHNSFAQLNYPLLWAAASSVGLFPDATVSITSPRDSERVAVHYTQAWLDRFLTPTNAAGRRVLDARLTAGTFDASSDASSTGQGTWDPVRGNVPYTIGGETTAEHLSPYAGSFMSLPGRTCADLRRGC